MAGVNARAAEETVNCVAIARGAGKDEKADVGRERENRLTAMTG